MHLKTNLVLHSGSIVAHEVYLSEVPLLLIENFSQLIRNIVIFCVCLCDVDLQSRRGSREAEFLSSIGSTYVVFSISDEFPEINRASIRQDHKGRFYEDFYKYVWVLCFFCLFFSLVVSYLT